MSDASVRAALRSDKGLVVIEAPAGCGKTHQGAEYAREVAVNSNGRVLILTHTHAACSVFAKRTLGAGPRVEIRTIDSLIGEVAAAYHSGLGLPPDVSGWARRTEEGYAQVASKVATLLERHPMVPSYLARRYPLVICDEHQDCTGDQHAISMLLYSHGARLRVFADPMQRIYKGIAPPGGRPPLDWASLSAASGAFVQLNTPHRWRQGSVELGDWSLQARRVLKDGGRIDLTAKLPHSVEVVIADNLAKRYGDYQVAPLNRRAIDTFERENGSLLVVSHHSATAQKLRAFFGRRLPLWEGHTRPALELLVDQTASCDRQPVALAKALVKFMSEVGTGFSSSAFGDRLISETREGCTRPARGKPAAIQAIARHLVEQPDHRGVASALATLHKCSKEHSAFADVRLDRRTEFWEAVRLGSYEDLESGLAQVTKQRTFSRPEPPSKAISTIHKAKGLECDGVIVMPCDAKTFPDTFEARCLLYVALSRAKKRLQLVVSRSSPSPLLVV